MVLLECMTIFWQMKCIPKSTEGRAGVGLHHEGDSAYQRPGREPDRDCPGFFFRGSHGPEMRRYVRESGRVNQKLAKEADVVIEVKFGLPLMLKGELPLELKGDGTV